MSESRRHLSRAAKKDKTYDCDYAWFPDAPALDEVHIEIAELNRQSLPYELSSYADDLIVSAMFGSKKDHPRWNDLVPDPISRRFKALGTSGLKDIRAAAQICSPLTNSIISGSIKRAVSIVCAKLYTIPAFDVQDTEWPVIVYKSVARFDRCWRRTDSHSLLYRYTLMYQQRSALRVCKAQFGNRVVFGLRATRDLLAGFFLIETCSSMSSDVVYEEGPSVVQSDPKQILPPGPRGVLGPFRFGNHKCGSKAQVRTV